MKYDDKSASSILEYANKLVGITFGEIDKYSRLDNSKGKGNLGQVVEESYFGYEVNSRAEADFVHAGIELKVTPYKVNKNKTISAKERLVLNIINYMEEYKYTFYESSFWKKNKELLLVFYEWQKDIDKKKYIIKDVMLHQFSEEDLVVIQDDWKTIINKIKAGKAHEISEADTNYLGACSKGANKNSVRQQPFSDILAMQRAFSLKSSYMTNIIRNRFGNKEESSISILKGSKKTIEEVLNDRFKPYYGKSIDEICSELNINLISKKGTIPKNYAQIISSKILGIKDNKIENIEEFCKANIKFKTVRIEKNNKIKQHMSLETFKYTEIIKETWEDSKLRTMFAEQKYLFVVFRYDKDDILRLDKIKLWNMPLSVLDTKLKETWEETVRVIKDGLIIEVKGSKTFDNMPASTFNRVCHTRPHAQNKNDTYTLPDGREHVKKCFWLDRDYILSILS